METNLPGNPRHHYKSNFTSVLYALASRYLCLCLQQEAMSGIYWNARHIYYENLIDSAKDRRQ